jgi:4-amino-4-deoxy-L-arabinose transferase-like glycosyltransferase
MTAEQWATVVMGVGFVFQFFARHIMENSDPGARSGLLGVVVFVLGTAIMVWGCTRYAFAKGYPRWLGVLGLLSCLGPIVLYFLPKRPKEAVAVERSVQSPGDS